MFQKYARVKIVFIFTALFFFETKAHSNSDDQKAFTLAKQNACLGCHAVDKKIVGPSFQSVAKKYQHDQNAPTFLKNKIAKGGSWGVVPMPANTKLSDADLSLMVGWILRGAPKQN